MRGEQGPPGERGMQGNEGPEGPRGSIGLWSALALILVGFGTAAGFIISGAVGKDEERPDQANRLGAPVTFAGEFGAPGSPQPIQQNSAYAHYDIQIHNRGNPAQWDATVNAQHTTTCGAPPGSHPVTAVDQSVYICNDHVMTTGNAGGYGEIVLTPSQLLDCSAGCTVQFDMSTERMSTRDWPDVWLTPWNDNLALPIEPFLPDLQGMPRRGIHVGAQPGNNSWSVATIDNYAHTMWVNPWWIPMGDGVVAGTNQAAVRQKFQLTVTPGHVKFERLASATAPALVFVDQDAPVLLAPDYVVQFAQHTYNPTKDGAGVPATWHWANFTLSPSTPFTLIHTTPALTTVNNSTVTFNAPAPTNAFLRFSGLCKVFIDNNLAPKMTFTGAYELVSSYFIPVAAGKTSVSVRFEADNWYNGQAAPCHVKDVHVWSQGGVAPPPTPTPAAPSPTLTPSPVPPTATPAPVTPLPPTPTPIVPVPTSTPTPQGGTLVTFDTLAGQNQPLNGQYPIGLINWGNNKWFLSGPWAPFSTKSISFNNGNGTQRTFAFVNPRVLVSLKAGGSGPSTITLSCAGNPNKVQSIAPNVVTTIATGWTVPCTNVTVQSSNGWETNFDDLLVQ